MFSGSIPELVNSLSLKELETMVVPIPKEEAITTTFYNEFIIPNLVLLIILFGMCVFGYIMYKFKKKINKKSKIKKQYVNNDINKDLYDEVEIR